MKTSHLHALACTKTVTEILQNCRLKITASGIWPTQTHQIKKSKKISIGNVVLESRFSGIYFKLSELRALARTKPVTDLDTFFSIFAKSAFQDGPDLVGVRQSIMSAYSKQWVNITIWNVWFQEVSGLDQSPHWLIPSSSCFWVGSTKGLSEQ